MANIFEDGLECVYPEKKILLSEDFVGVRDAVLNLDFIPSLDTDPNLCNQETSSLNIPSEINLLENDVVLILSTGRGHNWVEQRDKDMHDRESVTSVLKEVVDVKGYFINEGGRKGYLQIFFVDGHPYSEAYWIKTNSHTYELKQLITPDGEVISAYSLDPDLKKKSVEMPGTNMYIPFKKNVDF